MSSYSLKIKSSPILLFIIFFLGALAASTLVHESVQLKFFLQAVIFLAVGLLILVAGKEALLALLGSIVLFAPFFYFGGGAPIVVHFIISFMLVLSLLLIKEGDLTMFFYGMRPAWFGAFMGICVVVFASYLGVIQTKEFYVSTTGSYKSSLGFFNPNAAGVLAAGLFILSRFIGDKVKIYTSLIVFGFVFSMAASRTSILIVVIFFLFWVLVSFFSVTMKRVVISFFCLGSLGFMLMLIYLAWHPELMDHPFLEYVDRLLSFRLSVSMRALEDVSLEGGVVPGGWDTNVDFSWYNIIVGFGFSFVLLYVLAIFIFSFLVERRYLNLIILCVVISISSFFGENIIYVYFLLSIFVVFPAVLFLYSAFQRRLLV